MCVCVSCGCHHVRGLNWYDMFMNQFLSIWIMIWPMWCGHCAECCNSCCRRNRLGSFSLQLFPFDFNSLSHFQQLANFSTPWPRSLPCCMLAYKSKKRRCKFVYVRASALRYIYGEIREKHRTTNVLHKSEARAKRNIPTNDTAHTHTHFLRDEVSFHGFGSCLYRLHLYTYFSFNILHLRGKSEMENYKQHAYSTTQPHMKRVRAREMGTRDADIGLLRAFSMCCVRFLHNTMFSKTNNSSRLYKNTISFMQFPHCSVLSLSYLICIIQKLFGILQQWINCVGTRTHFERGKKHTESERFASLDNLSFFAFLLGLQFIWTVCLNYNLISTLTRLFYYSFISSL